MSGVRQPVNPPTDLATSDRLSPGAEPETAGTTAEGAVLPADRQRIQFRPLSDGLLFTFVVAGPTSLWESLWRGRPMIDQPGNLWIVPTVIVVITFLVGGAIAGRLHPRPMGAVVQALALAIPVAVVLILADLARRLIINIPLFVPVIELWIDALVSAIVLAAVGALTGRWLHRRRRPPTSPTVASTGSNYAQGGA
jgi:multisubunit Na+/H+ antiporter MnhB subunit